MRHLMLTAALAIAIAACGGNPAPAGPGGQPAMAPAANAVAAAAMTITPDDMYRRIAYLASDELKGRDTPSPGLEMAAEYIAGEFRSFRLAPGGDDGAFIQRWPYEHTSFDPAGSGMTFRAGGTTVDATMGRDFFAIPAMNADSAAAPLVWAGVAQPGRTPAGQAVAGSFAAIYLPGTSPDAQWQNGLQTAVTTVIGGGPRGILLVLDPGFDSGMISQIAGEALNQPSPIYMVGIDYATARRAFAAAGSDLDALRTGSATSVAPIEGATAVVRVAKVTTVDNPPNVVGMLMGSDPTLRDQYIVISAHMDHVGTGAPDASGDSIFNGADDDASGTATLMEVAEAFASMPRRPARSLIFVAVSGEEKGLFGSAYFTENPPVPINRIVANINIDMVGRNAPDSIIAIGQDYTSLGPLAHEVSDSHPEVGLTIAEDMMPEERLFFRSDHFNFAKAGVPAIFFTTGLHDQYHKQSDEVELIDRDKISRVGKLVFYLANEIATRRDAPTWTQKGITEVQPAGRGGGG